MTKKLNESDDLKLVSDYFSEIGLNAERFPKSETRIHGNRTPDFKIFKDGDLVAFCEVKSSHNDWLDEQLDNSQPGLLVGGSRNDSIFNKLSSAIHNAVDQFESVNECLNKLNVLAIVSHYDKIGPHDLRETITGDFLADNGKSYPTMKHISEGRIKEDKLKIDLYLWFDFKTKSFINKFFNDFDQTRLERTRKLFIL